ncbi:MAG: uL13 family ribosomal protein, partial [Acidobacteria bacterium]|nr:uL13 family ribosomal protein [Acidobacteriota bacterium]
GLRQITAGKLLKQKPTRVLELAIHGMLPKNRLGKKVRHKLKVYSGPEHPHQAQQPQRVKISA